MGAVLVATRINESGSMRQGRIREQLRALAVLSLLQAAAGGSVLDASEQALEMQAARWIDEFDKDDNDRLSTTELNVLMKAMMSTRLESALST